MPPTDLVEIAFASSPGAASPVYTNVTPYVKAVRIERGRAREIDRYKPAELTLMIEDPDRRFDPTNTASPYYPNVQPDKKVRVTRTWASVTYRRFVGFIEDWPLEYPTVPGLTHLQIKATDGFLALAKAPMPDSVWAYEISKDSPNHEYPMDDAATGVVADSVGNVDGEAANVTGSASALPSGLGGATFDGASSIVVIPAGAGVNSSTFTIAMIVDAEDFAPGQGLFPIVASQPGAFTIAVDVDGLLGIMGSLIVNVTDGTTIRQYQSGRALWSGANLVEFTYAAGTAHLYVNGVDITNTLAGGSVTPQFGAPIYVGHPGPGGAGVPFKGVIGHLMIRNGTAVAASRVVAHSAAVFTPWEGDTAGARVNHILDAIPNGGWPSGDRSIDTGQSILQAAVGPFGMALEELYKVNDAEQGALYMEAGKVRFRERHARLKSPYTTSQATFYDDDPATPGGALMYEDLVPAYPAELIRNIVRITRKGGTEQEATDTTGSYLTREFSLSDLPLANDNASRDLATWIRDHYKDPHFRFSEIVLTAYGQEAAMYPQMLGRAMDDRITVVKHFATGPTLSLDVYIEGRIEEFDGAGHDVVRFQLSPVESQTYWVLGTSALGTGTRLAY